MVYTTQTALRAEAQESHVLPRNDARESFELIVGQGLDAQARAGVSPVFLARVRGVVAVVLALIVLGVARVLLTTRTVELLRSNVETRELITQAEATGDSLRIDRSVLANPQRITNIVEEEFSDLVMSDERIAIDVSPYFINRAAHNTSAEVAEQTLAEHGV